MKSKLMVRDRDIAEVCALLMLLSITEQVYGSNRRCGITIWSRSINSLANESSLIVVLSFWSQHAAAREK